VVFVGYSAGKTDLYLYDVERNVFRLLTDDEWSEDDPYWYDDSTVIYVSDRNDRGEIGAYAIFRINVDGGEPEYVWGRRKILRSPIRWRDGIAFLTDHRGAVNMFLLRGDSLYLLTDYFTEVSHPDVSENGRVAFSMMWEGGWDVFLGYSSFYGTVGAFYMLFSDIPGDNWIFFQILGQSQDISNSEFVLTWYNFKGRIDKVFGISQLWNFKYLSPYFVYEKRLSGDIGLQYPFTRYFRAEGYFSVHYNTWIMLHEDSLLNYYPNCVNYGLPCTSPRLSYPKGYEVMASLVYDDVLLTYYGSTDGLRWRMVGATSLPGSQVDFKTVFFEGMFFKRITHRSIWANRLVLGRSVGKHKDAFTAGGPYGVRAYDLFYFFYDEYGHGDTFPVSGQA